jgi:hypothetical protein
VALPRFVFEDFSGGWNTRDGPFELRDNESPDLLNVSLTTRGAVKERLGKVQFDTSGFPAAKRAEHLRAWLPGSSKFLMASIDGDIYSCDAAGVFTSRFDGTAASVWQFEDMQASDGTQYLWALNGVDEPKRISTAFTVTNWTATPLDVGVTTAFMRVWRNRMIICTGAFGTSVNQRRLFISAIGNPESFTSTDFIDVKASDDDTDPVIWMEILGDNLLVFKRRSVWSLYAEPPTPAIRLLDQVGIEDRFQSCVVDGRCYYWNRSGLWSTDGVNQSREETANIRNYLQDNLNHARHNQVRVCPGRDRRVFVAACTASATENNLMLELVPYLRHSERPSGTNSGAWTRHDLPVYGMATFRSGNVDRLIGGASNAAEAHGLFEGASDDGVAIHAYWQSSWKSLVASEKYERVRRVNVLMEGQATLSLLADFSSNVSFSELLSVPAGVDPLWDGGTWDGGVWDSASNAGLKRARPETRARYHSVKIDNTELNKAFTIYSIEMMIRGGKEH